MELIRTDAGLAVDTGRAPPVALGYILGIGRNYADHAREQGAELPTRPMVFGKSPRSACLSGEEIVVPAVCQDREQVDWEAELAVIIGTGPGGRPCRDVPEPDALSYVLGYTCGNDVSARWWQKEGSGGQFNRGKSFDTFCPLGPRVLPAAEVPDPQALRILCRVNGRVTQDASTGSMVFSVRALVADLSRGATLPPGTVIMTGTPAGVGMSRKPPLFLKHGDVVEVQIEPIGTLTNRVRFE
ncbi:MAG: fumarylacetoacetate hydrolase family protein [Phycisphaerae bacterium]|nr:fumarylacetoacetate hydrolase family protein [Phycisphaerae bacterium]